MPVYQHGQSVIELPFLDFAPDLAYDATSSQKQVVLIDMDNAMPSMKGYQALNGLKPFQGSGAAPQPVLGSTVAYFTSNGATKVYAGGANNIYRLDGNAYTTVGSGYNVNQRWRFTQFGDDVIAVNPTAGAYPQVCTGSTGNFSPLAGSPPAGAVTAVSVNGQVLMFAGANWYCSALGTDNDWVPNIQTQSGQGVLYDYPGPVVAAAPIFRNIIVFKETATWLGNYVGGYPVWSWQLISDLTGTWAQESVIALPDGVAFVGRDDFYFCAGYTPQRIPNSLKEWFFDISNPDYFKNMLSRYDSAHGVCYWYFTSRSAPSSVPDRWVAWNARTGRWSAGYNPVGAFNIPTPNQQPGLLNGFMFDANQILQSWTDAPGAMRLETSYMGSPNALSQCMRMKPIFYTAPDTETVQPFHVRNLGDTDIVGPIPVEDGKDGWFYFRQYDRWHRFQVVTVGPNIVPSTLALTGAEISAIAIDLRPGGWR